MLTWLRKFRDCWRLARKIQRGELIAVRPGLLSAVTTAGPAGSITFTNITPRPPEAVEVAVDEPPGKQWQIRMVRGDIVKVLASFVDPREAMRFWNAYKRNVPGGEVQLYDAATDVVRGTR